MNIFSGFLRGLLDIVFPRDDVAEKLGRMSAEEFLKVAKPAKLVPDFNIISLFSYKDPLAREAIWQLKYRHNFEVAKLLAEVMYIALSKTFKTFWQVSGDKLPLLIPIPLSKLRMKERGYNQVEILACELEKAMRSRQSEPLCVVELCALQKIKDTSSQVKSVSRAERLKNLLDCFECDIQRVQGRSVILLDDVTTTGATIHEAIKVLRNAGATRVLTITLAH